MRVDGCLKVCYKTVNVTGNKIFRIHSLQNRAAAYHRVIDGSHHAVSAGHRV